MIPRFLHAAPLELGFPPAGVAIDMSLLPELRQTQCYSTSSHFRRAGGARPAQTIVELRRVLANHEYVVIAGLPVGNTFHHRLQLVSMRLADGALATYSYNVW